MHFYDGKNEKYIPILMMWISMLTRHIHHCSLKLHVMILQPTGTRAVSSLHVFSIAMAVNLPTFKSTRFEICSEGIPHNFKCKSLHYTLRVLASTFIFRWYTDTLIHTGKTPCWGLTHSDQIWRRWWPIFDIIRFSSEVLKNIYIYNIHRYFSCI